MIPRHRRRALVALAVALSVGFVVLAHAAMVNGAPPAAGAAMSLVPIAVLLFIAVRRGRAGLAFVAVAALAGLGLWLGWGKLERHFPDVLFVEHAGMNLALAALFGRTLRPGRDPLVTQFARIAHGGSIAPQVERYARGATLAWSVFFVTIFLVSCALYFGGLRQAWSLLANILSPILVMSMFALEYAVRRVVLRDHEQVGILAGVRAFVNHMQASRAEAPR